MTTQVAQQAAGFDEAAQIQAEARQTYRRAIAEGRVLTGRELGEMFGRGERWGRARIAEVRQQDDRIPNRHGSGIGRQNGNSQAIGHLAQSRSGSESGPNPYGPTSSTDAAHHGIRSAHNGTDPAVNGIASPSGARRRQSSQPAGARLVAWSAFVLGIAASVAANVAHAHPGIGPRIAAAFIPFALLLAVECMTRPRWLRAGFWWGIARYGGTGLVAVVAAVMSYRHMRSLLASYGEDPLNAAIGPLAVDGLMVVAGFALLAMNHADERTSR